MNLFHWCSVDAEEVWSVVGIFVLYLVLYLVLDLNVANLTLSSKSKSFVLAFVLCSSTGRTLIFPVLPVLVEGILEVVSLTPVPMPF